MLYSVKDILELDGRQQELYKKEKIADIYPEYYILKINQFDDVARSTIDEWIYFFKHDGIKEEFKARGLKEAKKELDIMKLPEANLGGGLRSTKSLAKTSEL